MINRENTLDKVVQWREYAMTDLKYARDHSGSERIREYTSALEAAMWRSTCLCRTVVRDLEEVCLGQSRPLKHHSSEYECLGNLLPQFRAEYLDLYQMMPLWDDLAQSVEGPDYVPVPADARDRLVKGAVNATQVIDHALLMYRSTVESANGIRFDGRSRSEPLPPGHNTLVQVASRIRRIRLELPRLERDIQADQAQLDISIDIPAAFRELASEIRSLTAEAHRLHVELVKGMESWLSASGPLAFDQSAYLRIRGRLSWFSRFTGPVCRHYGYERMKSGSMPRPEGGLCKRLWRMVYLAQGTVASSLRACEELAMAATGLPSSPLPWREEH